MVRTVGAVFVALLVLLSGCLSIPLPHEGVFVLSFTMVHTGQERKEANPGPHCGDAWIRDDVLHLERSRFDDVKGDPAFLVVLPSLEGAWASLGSEGYPMELPADVGSGVRDDETSLASVSWNAGQIFVDDHPVVLPHEWRVDAEDGSWWADLRLEEGPGQVVTFKRGNCM